MKPKSFVSGTIILMIAGFVVKIFGFVYRIYLSNLIGAEGMGLFQLISPIYSLIILTLTSGISVAVSKMVAEEVVKKHLVNAKRITFYATILISFIGIIVSIALYIFVDQITDILLKDHRTYYSLILLIPCIPIIAISSALKGYFYGISQVVPTAISQIVEQIVKMGIVMYMAYYFLPMGLEYACALAIGGMALGEVSNLIILIIIYKNKGRTGEYCNTSTQLMRKRKIIKDIIKISVPVSFNRFVTSVMAAIELILIPRMLCVGGLEYHKSMELYGKLAGMAIPLIFFPALVTSSIAITLVPAISEALCLKNYRVVNYRISKSIQVTFIIGVIFNFIFAAFSNEISDLIYKKESIGGMLFMLSFTCTFFYLQQTLLGVLNGLGKQGVSLRNAVLGYVIRIAFVYFCIPVYGILGYVLGLVVSMVFISVLNLLTIVKTTGMLIDIRNWIIKPGIIGLIMVFICKYIYSFFTIFEVGYTWTVMFAITSNTLIAFFLMMVIGVLEKEQIIKLLGIKRK